MCNTTIPSRLLKRCRSCSPKRRRTRAKTESLEKLLASLNVRAEAASQPELQMNSKRPRVSNTSAAGYQSRRRIERSTLVGKKRKAGEEFPEPCKKSKSE